MNKRINLQMTEVISFHISLLSVISHIFIYLYSIQVYFSIQSFIDIHRSYISLRGIREREARGSLLPS